MDGVDPLRGSSDSPWRRCSPGDGGPSREWRRLERELAVASLARGDFRRWTTG